MIILTPQIYACNRYNTNTYNQVWMGDVLMLLFSLNVCFLSIFSPIFSGLWCKIRSRKYISTSGRVAFMNPWQIHYKEDLSGKFDENSIQKLFPSSSYAIEVAAAALFGSFQWTFFELFNFLFSKVFFFQRCSFLKC